MSSGEFKNGEKPSSSALICHQPSEQVLGRVHAGDLRRTAIHGKQTEVSAKFSCCFTRLCDKSTRRENGKYESEKIDNLVSYPEPTCLSLTREGYAIPAQT